MIAGGPRKPPRPRTGLRRACLGLSATAALIAWLGPHLPREAPLRDLLVVVDITRSMNVRDMAPPATGLQADPESRLDATARILPEVLQHLPCGSRVGLGVFTERRSLTFLDPVEICANHAVIASVLNTLDWRMAWEGDSLIARGLLHARARAAALGADLVFVTDGHEAPPLPHAGPPPVPDMPQPVAGLIIGAGGSIAAPIPRFDREGREIGFYRPEDVQQAPARIGPPPADAAQRPGFHPRNNPYGESDLVAEEHLSSLRAAYLRDRAEAMGLGYVALSDGPAAIRSALLQSTRRREGPGRWSLAPAFAAAALCLICASYLLALQPRNFRRPRPHLFHPERNAS